MVRIWRPSPAYDTDGDQTEPGRLPLRGVVRRVADGTELPFAGVDELIDLLSATPASPAPAGGREQGRQRATNEARHG